MRTAERAMVIPGRSDGPRALDQYLLTLLESLAAQSKLQPSDAVIVGGGRRIADDLGVTPGPSCPRGQCICRLVTLVAASPRIPTAMLADLHTVLPPGFTRPRLRPCGIQRAVRSGRGAAAGPGCLHGDGRQSCGPSARIRANRSDPGRRRCYGG